MITSSKEATHSKEVAHSAEVDSLSNMPDIMAVVSNLTSSLVKGALTSVKKRLRFQALVGSLVDGESSIQYICKIHKSCNQRKP